jgi:hypothetical protein
VWGLLVVLLLSVGCVLLDAGQGQGQCHLCVICVAALPGVGWGGVGEVGWGWVGLGWVGVGWVGWGGMGWGGMGWGLQTGKHGEGGGEGLGKGVGKDGYAWLHVHGAQHACHVAV